MLWSRWENCWDFERRWADANRKSSARLYLSFRQWWLSRLINIIVFDFITITIIIILIVLVVVAIIIFNIFIIVIVKLFLPLFLILIILLAFIRGHEYRVVSGSSDALDVDVFVISSGTNQASISGTTKLRNAIGNPAKRSFETHAVIRTDGQRNRIPEGVEGIILANGTLALLILFWMTNGE